MMSPMNPFAVEARIRDLSDRAATEFLSPLSEKRGSPDYIAKNAEQILKAAGVDLTAIVVKIAQDENLNPHEVARVCEESNKEVFGRLYKSSDDKTFEFAVADVGRVLADLNRPYEGPGDIFLPVEHPKYAHEKTASEKKAPSTSWAATALMPSEAQALQMSHEEEKVARDAFGELHLESKAEQHQAALDFLKMARDFVLEGQRTPSELFAMVKEARPEPAHQAKARELLALVAMDTGARFPEGADLVVKFAKDLITSSETGGGEQPSDDLRHVTAEDYDFWTRSPGAQPRELVGPASSGGDPVVINGRHALFITLDTLVDQCGKENSYGKGLLIAGDKVRTVARSIVNWKPKTENLAI
jgi:hypothetical protein